MKVLSILFLSAIFFSSDCFADDSSKEGQYFINFATLTSQYTFELNDTLDELPAGFNAQLGNLINETDEDVLNNSFGFGYYLSDHLSLRANYVDDIGLFNINFIGILFGSNEFEGEMSILEIDAKYNFLEINENVSFFVTAGAAYHQLDARIIDFGNSNIEDRVLLQKDVSKWESKIGLGIQFDFYQNMGINFGYARYSFISMDKTYIEFEYRF